MLVKDLIEQLSQYPLDAEVAINDPHRGHYYEGDPSADFELNAYHDEAGFIMAVVIDVGGTEV